MGNVRRSGAVVIVLGTAAIAACLSSPLASLFQTVVTVDNNAHDFGTQPVNGSGSGFVFTVSPKQMSDNDYITSITFDSTCPDFSLDLSMSPPGLILSANGDAYGSAHVYFNCFAIGPTDGVPAGDPVCQVFTYPFNTVFAPTQPGMQTCMLDIHTESGSNAGSGDVPITLSGSGAVSLMGMSLKPMMIDFGTVPTGQPSATRTITVTNTGTTPLTVTGSSSSPVFTLAPTMQAIAVGMSQMYTVSCDPPAAQFYSGTITFTSPGVTPSPMVGLSCTGVTTSLSFSPNPIDFGTLIVGQAAITRPMTITNSVSGSEVMVSNFTFGSGSDPNLSYNPMPFATSLGAGGTDTITVQYNPATANATGSLGTVAFQANGQPLTVPIVGYALVGSIGADPASVDFGPICAGGSGSQDVAISTNAAAPVTVSAMGPPTSPFGATTMATFPDQLLGHGGNTITITTSVTLAADAAAGDVTGQFTLTTNIPNMATSSIPLHALVLAGGSLPTPDSLAFGAVMTGTTAPGKQVTFTNCGTAPLMVNGSHLTGPNLTEFVVVPPMPQALPPAQSLVFVVTMVPVSNGDKTATMVIDYDGGSAAVALDGTGYGGSADTTDRQTYYACSAGGSVAMWPIGLALLALRRRRR